MISFDFDYYKPTSITEAVQLYQQLDNEGKKPLYYGGGSEIITMARLQQVQTEAVIDIKAIPECTIYENKDGQVTIGAAVPLAKVATNPYFPLLSATCKKIADHTSRYHITVGGNLCGHIVYREAVLPFLLADSLVKIASPSGERTVPLNDIFTRSLSLQPGELLVQIFTDEKFTTLPYSSLRKVQQVHIDYPIVTVAALKDGERMRVAFSGLYDYPFRSHKVEAELNDTTLSAAQRIDNAIAQLSAPVLDDIRASAGYRQFVLRNTLAETLEYLEGVTQ